MADSELKAKTPARFFFIGEISFSFDRFRRDPLALGGRQRIFLQAFQRNGLALIGYGRGQADQHAIGSLGVDVAAINRRHAARAVARLLVVKGGGGRRFPELFAGRRIEGQNILAVTAPALSVEAALDDDWRRVSFAKPTGLPQHARPTCGPGSGQSGFTRNAVAARPAPLRPVRNNSREREEV